MILVAWVLAVVLGVGGEPRQHEGPSSVAWSAGDAPYPTSEPTRAAPKQPAPPPPRPVKQATIAVAVGLSLEAPGTKQEKSLLDRLYASAEASVDPPTHVRRLRPGAGDPRTICRERRDDLVVMLGYLPERESPVVLAHDCRLDVALAVRSAAAVDEPGLIASLWEEHERLVRQGMRERRRVLKLGPGARAGIVAGVALVVIGVAVGVLVASALRDEKVVLKVSP